MNNAWVWAGIGLFCLGLGAGLAWTLLVVGHQSEEVSRTWTF